jgi:hypothetical protein
LIEQYGCYQAYLYNIERNDRSGEVKWILVRKIEDYLSTYKTPPKNLEFFTPDFSRYLIIDKNDNKFVIKETHSSKAAIDVPGDCLVLKDSDPLKVLNSLKWIDNDLMKVVSPEGSEKIVNVSNDFEE